MRSSRRTDSGGYSLVELLVALGVTTMIMGATMTGLSDAMRANETVVMVTSMNNMLRVSMDLLVRDLLQVGSGLPPGHVVSTPHGDQSQPVYLPGPPGTSFTTESGQTDLAAVMPGTGLGPVVNGVATDTITVLMADNNFVNIQVTGVTPTSADVHADSLPIHVGPNKVSPGQLMMITKGSYSTLVQVSDVLTGPGKIMFDAADSMNLNQPQAKEGSLAALDDAPPKNGPATITRIRMVSYYLDTAVPGRPRLVRRVNNGDAVTFNNDLGTAVGLDIENLQISYDLVDGNSNPSNVRFTAADLAGTGACAPDPCSRTQIRKVNVALTARSRNAATGNPNARVYRNTLTSQVSLRGMAFVNEYQGP